LPIKSDTNNAATPMMQQYIEIKSVNPGSLLFYRMGDFYELFFEDAEIAARALGITLTKRGKHLGEDIPMCGVPVHAAEDYLQRLITLGHRIAVCEQTENPAEAKKRGSKAVVKREVIRLVTPGTITEEKILEPSSSNFLCAMARAHNQAEETFALSWIDISTGNFNVMSIGRSEISSALARIEPRELILSEKLYHEEGFRDLLLMDEQAITLEANTFFDSQSAAGRLETEFGVKTTDGFADFTKAELSAAGAILAYVEKTQLGERPVILRPQREDEAESLFIDAATRANLELVRTLSGEKRGSLFHAINKTITGAGARLLGERMMSPLRIPAKIIERQETITLLLENPSLAEELRTLLKSIPDIARATSRLSLNRGGPRDLLAIATGLEAAILIGELFGKIENIPIEATTCLADINALPEDLLTFLKQTLNEEAPLLARDGGFVSQGQHQELDEMRALRDQSRRVIADLQAEYAELTGVKSLKIRHNNVLGYFIEVTANNAAALTSDEGKERFIHRQTMANAMRFTTTELADLESRIANAAGRALEIELELFDTMKERVLNFSTALNQGAMAVAVLDVSQGLAGLAEQWNYCRPRIDYSLAFDVRNGRHAVVEQVSKADNQNPFVPNDCRLGGAEAGKLWLLTGPNMGGKSTFLRQNALLIVLAQMGSYVPAQEAHIGVVDRLFSRVGAADDLARGRSTFMVEMVETAAILNQAEAHSFVILDEIGRGTATFDGLSIAWAAIEYLHEVNHCRTLFATHYHELTSLTEPLARLSNVTMKVREWQNDVVFLHEVVQGTADRSYGIQVAKLAGLPEAVVNRARNVLDQLEDTDRTNSAEALIDGLPLFSAEVTASVPQPPDESELIRMLEEIVPDDLTPREALQALYDLRAKILASK